MHYGKFVAEAKFAAHPATYTSLIKQQDTEGLMLLLTDVNVERKVWFGIHSCLQASSMGRLDPF